jgi:hypothetical protein
MMIKPPHALLLNITKKIIVKMEKKEIQIASTNGIQLTEINVLMIVDSQLPSIKNVMMAHRDSGKIY